MDAFSPAAAYTPLYTINIVSASAAEQVSLASNSGKEKDNYVIRSNPR
jgi:hypothetical protein